MYIIIINKVLVLYILFNMQYSKGLSSYNNINKWYIVYFYFKKVCIYYLYTYCYMLPCIFYIKVCF